MIVGAEAWQAALNAILKEWRTQDAAAPTLTQEKAVEALKKLGMSAGEALKSLRVNKDRP